jgi:hypothetical protein
MLFSQQISVASKVTGMGVQVHTSPNSVVFGNRLYLFYTGAGGDGIWYTSTDGQSWGTLQSVAALTPGMGVQTGTSANAVVFGNTLYLFYTGSGGDGIWYTSTTNGRSWTRLQSVAALAPGMGVQTGTNANAVVLGGTLYLFYTGSGNDGIWYTTTTNGQSWTSVRSVRAMAKGMGVQIGTSANAVLLGTTLYLFYTGSGNDGIWFTTTTNGQSWTPVQSVAAMTPGMGVEKLTSAAAMELWDTLYLFYTGSGEDGLFYTSTVNGRSWTPIQSMRASMPDGIQGVQTGSDASTAVFNGLPYVFWTGAGGDGTYYATGATYSVEQDLDAMLMKVMGSEEFFATVTDSSAVAYLSAYVSGATETPRGPVAGAIAQGSSTSLALVAEWAGPDDGSFVAPTSVKALNLPGARMLEPATTAIICLTVLALYAIRRGYNLNGTLSNGAWTLALTLGAPQPPSGPR